MFDDDWEAAEYLYPRSSSFLQKSSSQPHQQPLQPHLFRPPVTLLVISVGENIIFDPSREEIAVADTVLAVSVVREDDGNLKLLAIRTVDPPSRMTNPGVPNSENATTLGLGGGPTSTGVSSDKKTSETSASGPIGDDVSGVWKPRQGGVKRSVVTRIVKMVLEKGGVGDEVMEGLEGVEVG